MVSLLWQHKACVCNFASGCEHRRWSVVSSPTSISASPVNSARNTLQATCPGMDSDASEELEALRSVVISLQQVSDQYRATRDTAAVPECVSTLQICCLQNGDPQQKVPLQQRVQGAITAVEDLQEEERLPERFQETV